MRKIDILYGRAVQTLEVPEPRLNGVLEPDHSELSGAGEVELVMNALEHPMGTPRLCEMARGKERILVITSDHTRPVPSRITMPLLLREIRSGNPKAEIVILIATGLHRAPTREEIWEKFGPEIAAQETIVVHRADADESMVDLGALPSGGRLRVNGWVGWAQLVLSEGFIEPHFFAGFSGGRKSILPGIASKETVLYNHNAAFIRHPHARQGVLEGNPIHRDMAFAAEAAGLAFILNVLIDADKRVIAAFAGDPVRAHGAGCSLCRRMTCVKAVEADIVVTSNGGYPLDQNIYQAVKGMTAAEACVRAGGVIILCAALGDGHGGEAFYHWFADRPDVASVARAIESIPAEQTTSDQWQAQILARVMQKATVIFVTDGANRALLEAMHMRWAPDVNAALEQAVQLVGANADVTAIPDGVGVIVEG